ncbi:RHS repeat-associated protein [Dysgonomonas sp. PH5-45]|uniref:SpvB/TcaC N-terminal domain-containing protein n=1 Tax=unclassified Dysgonomonas TaxID=2630389 RepID=UPI0024736154|nr:MULTISPECIES: SpvB/TcaC N-terminal domain-containing protein [unclassified Dysgonomonas]MDH6353690.1 RHS repeat-associated protein [Dysgonomonas sp. PH5-45]MDH6386593.1 RHS repeat-associated protein [Dysgonomonas sp. PH5-37]
MKINYKTAITGALLATSILVGIAWNNPRIKEIKNQQTVVSPKTETNILPEGESSNVSASKPAVEFMSNSAEGSETTERIEYLSISKEGVIGLYDGKQVDNPSDNIFTVSLAESPELKDEVWLSFDLEGVNDYTNIPYSINDRLAVGGYLVKKSDASARQKIQINPLWLNQGNNFVQFTLPEDVEYGYKVSNLSIEVNKRSNNSFLVLNTVNLSYDNKAYIHGFVQDKTASDAVFYVNEKPIKSRNGEFETIVSLDDSRKVDVKAVLNGKNKTKSIVFPKNTRVDYAYDINTKVLYASKELKKGIADRIQLETACLEVDSAALLGSSKKISLTTLRDIDIPVMNMGLSNITADHKGYRFLPHGEHFADGARVVLKYDPTKIPKGFTEDDIRTFYFDMDTRLWAALEVDSIDKKNQLIISRTTHFTDMINGVIQVPESPETQGYTPTMMSDIQAADPTSKVQLISPPQANVRGSAGLSYSFEMPPARNGMAPNLSIAYNSDGGNGWLGEGWDLNIASINIDTRWGVPRYDDSYETETYLMDGSMLMTLHNNTASVAHRNDEIARIENRQFYPRNENSFSKIIRKGNSPSNYYWEVTDKSGTKYIYGTNGGTLKGNVTTTDGVQKNVAVEWKLSRVEELHGDYIEYHYQQVAEPITSGLSSQSLYLRTVKAGQVSKDPHTVVTFTSNTQKEKQTNNARYGFLTSSNKLLNGITIAFEGNTLRSYTFNYGTGAFNAKVLQSVTHLDSSGSEFATHTFDYYDDVNSSAGYKPFTESAEEWSLHNDNIETSMKNPMSSINVSGFSNKATALGGNTTTSQSISFYGGVGVGIDPTTISSTIGASTGYSSSTTEGLSTLIDIDGDGLPDKVFVDEGKLYYRPNISQATNVSHQYGDRIEIGGTIEEFSKTTSRSYSGGWKGSVGIFIATAAKGKDKSSTTSKIKVYFADVNNDGLVDIVSNGTVHFNKIITDSNGRLVPYFTTNSTGTPNPINGSGNLSLDEEDIQVDPEEQAEEIKNSPMQDVVRVWEAPFDGTVNVASTIKLLAPQGKYDTDEYSNADGVRAAIQFKSTEKATQTISLLNTGKPYPMNVNNLVVKAGEKLFFRLQSGRNEMSNGAFDQVEWSPVITYQGKPAFVNPNGESSIAYRAEEGTIYSEESWVRVDTVSNKVFLKGSFSKPITSDIVTLRIIAANERSIQANDNSEEQENPNYDEQIVYTRTFSKEAANIRLSDQIFGNIPSSNHKNLKFEIISDSNIEWYKIKWETGITSNGKEMHSLVPVEYKVYAKQLKTPIAPTVFTKEIYNVSISTTYLPSNIQDDTYLKSSDMIKEAIDLVMVVKDSTGVIAKMDVTVDETNYRKTSWEGSASFPYLPPGSYWFEYYLKDSSKYVTQLNHLGVRIIYNETLLIPFPLVVFSKADMYTSHKSSYFGPMYRGWGQFVYNSAEGRYATKINESALNYDKYADPNILKKDTMNFNSTVFFPMTVGLNPDSVKCWIGQNNQTHLMGTTMSSSRLGAQNVVLTNPLAGFNNMTMEGGGARGITLENKSTSTADLSKKMMGVSKSLARGNSSTKTAFMDINGDGYPDIISAQKIHMTNPQGGFSGIAIGNNNISETSNSSEGYSLDGSPIHSGSTSIRGLAGSKWFKDSKEIAAANDLAKNASKLPAISGGKSAGNDQADFIFMDINGDGLPDKVRKNSVQFNYGYSFSEEITWDLNDIQYGENTSSNGGLGYTFGSSFSIGAGFSKTSSKSSYILMDINSDGLPDKVWTSGSVVKVALNKGNGFAAPITWRGLSKINESASCSESINGAYTYNILIPTPWWITIKISLNPGLSKSKSMTRDLYAIRDVDGDGFPDIVLSDDDSQMTVYRSTIGRTNKLKTVNNPLGGSFTLDYTNTKATYNHPGGKWAMSSVEINDGINDDGGNMKTRFVYENGKHDRREREFLGFGKVITQSINTEDNDKIYRETVQTYNVSNIYEAGNLISTLIQDAAGKKYTETINKYYTYSVSKYNTNTYRFATVTIDSTTYAPLSIYAPLKYTKTLIYEGNTTGIVANEAYYTYYLTGHHGELSTYTYSDKGNLGERGRGSFNYYTQIAYINDFNKYVLSLPYQFMVSENSNVYRMIEAEYGDSYSPAHLTKVTQYTDSSSLPAVTDIVYDRYGNITSKTLPQNAKRQRMKYTYSYDDKYKMYVKDVSDSFGYTSKIDSIDYRYGIPLLSISKNGKKSRTAIDNLGRITSVTGPNEIHGQLRNPYTIRFEYHPSVVKNNKGNITSPAYAVTGHFDAQNRATSGDMETVTFVDGFGRVIQVKKDAAITSSNGQSTEDQMIVSGRMKYDCFGRAVKSYHPLTDALTNRNIFLRDFDTTSPTVTHYDVMDRAVRVVYPDGKASTMTYSKDNASRTLVSQQVDAKGGRQSIFTNGSGLTVKTEQYSGPNGTITTRFNYDGIGQLIETIDTEGNTTLSDYDYAGHRTRVTHPVSGVSTYQYDPQGNLTSRQTANLLAEDKYITYTYDFNRLTGINYPDNPENNVKYHYGDSYTDEDQRGRLILMEDASGAQQYTYGLMGEVTELTRTIVIPNQGVATYTTKWVYDSWNRLLNMSYPDTEKVNYTYNSGGLLCSVNGVKGRTYHYVTKLGYDKFEERSYLQYGNGVETFYSYDPQMRRLKNLKVSHSATNYMNSTYGYDAVGNVSSVSSPSFHHTYRYDGLYRLSSAVGDYTSTNGGLAQYTLQMSYDNLHNISNKYQMASQEGVTVESTSQGNAEIGDGYNLAYAYGSNPYQVSFIQEQKGDISGETEHRRTYDYDLNGNLTYVNFSRWKETGKRIPGGSERKLRWDEENRLSSISDNGYVSSYLYDASGERVVKSSGGSNGVFVNGVFSGGNTETTRFTTYVSPYLVVSPGGNYTKHIYVGSQRIVSKLGDAESFTSLPNTSECAGHNQGIDVGYNAKYARSVESIRKNYAYFNEEYNGMDNNPYTGGHACLCENDLPVSPMASSTNGLAVPKEERHQYFYHGDHLGSTTITTDANGDMAQSIQYTAFGEVFIEERYNNTWKTPFLFNAKELDEETGLYYYGARYYDPHTSLWLSVDPLAEKYPGMSPYAYCANNPLKFVDPTGEDIWVFYKDQDGNSQHWVFNGKNMRSAPIENEFVSDFLLSYDYNTRNGGGDKMKEAAMTKGLAVRLEKTLEESRRSSKMVDGKEISTVYWNPTQANITNEGYIYSPATVLEHEFDHGLSFEKDSKAHKDRVNTYDSQYTRKEERRVITGSEVKTARANKEFPKGYVRSSHTAKYDPIKVISPISTKRGSKVKYKLKIR